jgi:hypothetical protein
MKLASKFGAECERRVAKMTGGRTRPASGARWFAKGDVKTPTHLLQVKATTKKQYTLRLADLQEIERQAAAEDKEAAMIVEFTTPQGRLTYRIERHYGS